MNEEIKKLLDTPIKAAGSVEILAAKDDGEKKDGCKAMRINAYNGGLMRIGGFGLPVGIELAGLTWRDDSAIPILCLHDSFDIDAICGQAKKIKCNATSLEVEADFMPVSDTAKKVHALASAGYKFQASVGVSPSDIKYIAENETATLNGSEVNGECYIVRSGVLNEVSIVPLGADGSTNTAIAAAKTQGKEGIMPETTKEVTAAKPDTTADISAAQNAERERVASVIEACKGHDDIMAEAVKNGWTAEKAELACLRAEKAANEKAKIEAGRVSAPSVIDLKAAAAKVVDTKVIIAAACMGAAMSDRTVEAQFKGVDLDAAHDLGIRRISDIFAHFGFSYRPGVDGEMSKAIAAAFSTSDIPNVLSNVAHKFVLAGFGEVGEDWRQVVRPVSVSDFKAVKGTRLVMGGLLKPLAKGGELQHVSLSDSARDLAAATKGSIIGIPREDLINDDLGLLATVPQRFGQMAGRTINKDVFGAVSTTAADFGANSTGALSLTTVEEAYAKAMGIVDENGDPIGALPNKILCSNANYLKAVEIYRSTETQGAGSKSGKANTMQGLLEPVRTPYLTGTAYWLFNSAFPLVDAAFLNGVQTPVVETAQADFSQLGIQMRCYFDYGVAKGETKAALYSTGA